MVNEYVPKDWKSLQKEYPNWGHIDQGKLKRQWVSVRDIIGSEKDSNLIYLHRLEKIEKLVKDKEYDYKDDSPPCLIRINGKYFVMGDGNHRIIAFKRMGLRKIVADVSEGHLSSNSINKKKN